MQPSEVKALIEKALPGSNVIISGSGCDFQLTIVSDTFENMSAVKRQKCIYVHLSPFIQNGTIHAVSMQTYTPKEWTEHSHH